MSLCTKIGVKSNKRLCGRTRRMSLQKNLACVFANRKKWRLDQKKSRQALFAQISQILNDTHAERLINKKSHE
ncbi:hypothetical protein Pan258_51490 [Symmachiella dynata]|nr:hypothetical protein Pan258_51490 [Symmachiella dynata]